MATKLKKTRNSNGNGNGSSHTQEKEPILKIIKPRTVNQSEYLNSILESSVVLCTGPAGSGKTLLAAFAAAKALFDGEVTKIILTKPILEAGEQLGFLPGNILEKVDPHLKSLYDCLEKCLPRPIVRELLIRGDIEVCPLAYMRGRTFDNCFIVGDEFQNATYSQIKMFLTRLGENSKMVLTADPTQVDLPNPKDSGIIGLGKKLKLVEGISVIDLKAHDVQRSEIVKHMLEVL